MHAIDFKIIRKLLNTLFPFFINPLFSTHYLYFVVSIQLFFVFTAVYSYIYISLRSNKTEMTYSKNQIVSAFGVILVTVDNWIKAGRLTRVDTDNGRVAITRESVIREYEQQKLNHRTAGERLDEVHRFLFGDDEL